MHTRKTLRGHDEDPGLGKPLKFMALIGIILDSYWPSALAVTRPNVLPGAESKCQIKFGPDPNNDQTHLEISVQSLVAK